MSTTLYERSPYSQAFFQILPQSARGDLVKLAQTDPQRFQIKSVAGYSKAADGISDKYEMVLLNDSRLAAPIMHDQLKGFDKLRQLGAIWTDFVPEVRHRVPAGRGSHKKCGSRPFQLIGHRASPRSTSLTCP